ncbi:MAG TPA: protealysin inhibitor emfourin [Candidatus Eremiobacteraceae bacterium]|nr:protealysin inhibitor emfourin [Candidatus Eremiobacteraceae bacterium]
MKVSITRSGGIAGITTTASTDTGSLDAYRAHAIEAIVARMTAAASDSGAMMPDAFQYDVTITDDSGSKTMRFQGDPCPAADLFRAVQSTRKPPAL